MEEYKLEGKEEEEDGREGGREGRLVTEDGGRVKGGGVCVIDVQRWLR